VAPLAVKVLELPAQTVAVPVMFTVGVGFTIIFVVLVVVHKPLAPVTV
jgi:hypothetical protein